MTKLIAHRGNFAGQQPQLENSFDYLKRAIDLGYDVEIDARIVNNKMWLGHDEPKYELNYEQYMYLLTHREVWWHSKDYNTLTNLVNRGPWMKVFAHESDTYGLVNGGYIWTCDTTITLSEQNHTVFMIIGDISPHEDILKEGRVFGMCSDDFKGVKPK